MEGSIPDPFLNIGFSSASLHGSGRITDFMERVHILVTDFAKITAASFENLLRRSSIPAASEMSMFF